MPTLRQKPKKTERDTLAPHDSPTYVVFNTELGWMGCVWQGDQLDAVAFGRRTREAARAACTTLANSNPALHTADLGDEHVASLVERLQQYAAGADDDFLDIKLNLQSATPFQQRVTAFCRRIRAGQVLSYGQLAAKAGSPGAARAVGSVMSRNRFPLIVPCHRVIGGGGALGGYSAPTGYR